MRCLLSNCRLFCVQFWFLWRRNEESNVEKRTEQNLAILLRGSRLKTYTQKLMQPKRAVLRFLCQLVWTEFRLFFHQLLF